MEIITITKENIDKYPPTCFMKADTEGYKIKKDWILKQLKNGLTIKLLYDETDKKVHGFIEYIPGENAWRAIDAKNYMFIHCIWIYPNKYKHKGYATQLIEECEKDAKDKAGIAVITSDDTFMATRELFLKNNYKLIQEEGKQQLLVKQLKKQSPPKLKDHKAQLKKLKGWHIIYTKQCPWVTRFINELDQKLIEKLNIKITELKTPKQAQNAPSIYSTLNVIKDGKILADHYISNTRLNNIIKKES